MNDEIEGRRQRAREAFWDLIPMMTDPNSLPHDPYEAIRPAVEAAIETSTRVQITPEIMRAVERENVRGPVSIDAVRAAFVAAGFEVEL
jgi:hypothetical protein